MQFDLRIPSKLKDLKGYKHKLHIPADFVKWRNYEICGNYMRDFIDNRIVITSEFIDYQHSVRFMTKYSDIKDYAKEIDDNKIEFGYYPQSRLSSNEKNYESKKTGNEFHIPCRYGEDCKIEIYPEYELTNGLRFINDIGNLYIVEPIIWIVDKRRDIAICDRPLLGNLPNNPYLLVHYEGEIVDRYDLNELINVYVKKDIIKYSKPEFEQNTSKENNAHIITEQNYEINEKVKYLFSIIKTKEIYEIIQSKVKKLINEYNNELDKIKEDKINKTNEINLTLNVKKSSSLIKRELLFELDNLINKVQNYEENASLICTLSNDINNSLSLLNKEDVNILPNSLSEDIYLLVKNILLNLENKENYLEEIKSIFELEKEKVKDYLINTFDNKESILNPKVEEVNIRSKLQIIYEKILQEISIDTIKNNIIKIINGIYENTNSNAISFYLNLINDITKSIRSKSESYEEDINKILKFDIDKSKNIMEIIKILQNVIVELYKIEYDIDMIDKEIEDIENSKFSID